MAADASGATVVIEAAATKARPAEEEPAVVENVVVEEVVHVIPAAAQEA